LAGEELNRKLMRPLLETREEDVGKISVASWPVFVMPRDATPILVIALVEAMERLGQGVEFSLLANRFRSAGSSALISGLKIAQELGLLRIDGTEVLITSLGSEFAKASEAKVRIIRSGLSRMEPFRTALHLLSRSKSVSALEVAESLGVMKERDVLSLLIEWAISSGLLRYNGKTREFQLT
jgi:hypothetical protein